VLEEEIRIRDDLIQGLEKKVSASVEKGGAGSEKPSGLIFRFKR
jgi:hypothetical protein